MTPVVSVAKLVAVVDGNDVAIEPLLDIAARVGAALEILIDYFGAETIDKKKEFTASGTYATANYIGGIFKANTRKDGRHHAGQMHGAILARVVWGYEFSSIFARSSRCP